MAQPTLTQRVDALTAAVEALVGLVAPIVASTTAPAVATDVASVKRSKDGRDFPCTADGGCGRKLRSEARAAIHGIDAGGHAAA